MRKLGEVWIPAIVLVFGVAYYHSTRGLPELSVAFPQFLMVLMPILAAVIFVSESRKGDGSHDPSMQPTSFGTALIALRNPAILLGSAILYLALFVATNFIIATVTYLATTMVALRVHWTKAIAIACGFTFGLYGVFGYLFAVQI
ncbi:MAG: tripartite tricarboxylate transporter TctB family protein [Alphaproteobacteria bacterium]|nr:tripartite tricarboxylate transporter TctB family protein [Alphaproteobacteria bacterium]